MTTPPEHAATVREALVWTDAHRKWPHLYRRQILLADEVTSLAERATELERALQRIRAWNEDSGTMSIDVALIVADAIGDPE